MAGRGADKSSAYCQIMLLRIESILSVYIHLSSSTHVGTLPAYRSKTSRHRWPASAPASKTALTYASSRDSSSEWFVRTCNADAYTRGSSVRQSTCTIVGERRSAYGSPSRSCAWIFVSAAAFGESRTIYDARQHDRSSASGQQARAV